MQIYLSVAPQQAPSAAAYKVSLACMAYHIGSSSTLLRQNALLQTQCGLLAVSESNAPIVENPQSLCSAVLRECSRRSYDGVFLDFPHAPRPDLLAFTKHLDEALLNSKKKLYLPNSYLTPDSHALTLTDTALSGGNLREHLKENASNHKKGTALRMERIRMDFQLPARSGTGKALSSEEFNILLAQKSPSIFFSPDLCARYFTYQAHSETHFVLFDDAETLKRKLQLGAEYGFSAAFFKWDEIKDIAEQLLPLK